MEENEVIEDTIVSAELKAEIEAKVAELKKENPKARVIYPIVVEGTEYDEKENYIGYFGQPSFKTFSKYLSMIQSGNQAVAMRTLANECFIAGDKDLVDNDSLFLFGLMGQLSKVIEMRNGALVNLSSRAK
jgi:hypothetical protein